MEKCFAIIGATTAVLVLILFSIFFVFAPKIKCEPMVGLYTKNPATKVISKDQTTIFAANPIVAFQKADNDKKMIQMSLPLAIETLNLEEVNKDRVIVMNTNCSQVNVTFNYDKQEAIVGASFHVELVEPIDEQEECSFSAPEFIFDPKKEYFACDKIVYRCIGKENKRIMDLHLIDVAVQLLSDPKKEGALYKTKKECASKKTVDV